MAIDVTKYRQKLEGRLAELDTRLHEIEHELESPVSADWDERAIEREDDEALEGVGQAGLQEARAIHAALDRIERGTYGVCAQCEEPISTARLDAVPYATLCKTCATAKA